MGTKSLAQIPRIEEFFDPEDANASCLRLVRHLSEDWKLDDSQIKLRPFEEGITNTIMKVTPLRNGKADADAEQESVLIRGRLQEGARFIFPRRLAYACLQA